MQYVLQASAQYRGWYSGTCTVPSGRAGSGEKVHGDVFKQQSGTWGKKVLGEDH